MEGLVRLRGLVQSELEYSDTIATLAAATEARDPATHGHTARVAEIAVRIGQAMKLPDERVRVLARAGLLHDIGKLGIPDAILLKPGPLTEDEWRIMRTHPELGHDIVQRAGSLEAESRLVRMHHERLDGAGYSHGLAGSEIPIDARILSVADVYDALVTHRPYRDGYPSERALELLSEEAGSHLDPAVIDVWTALCPIYHVDVERGSSQ
jgi:HD-GYP domain-containing protein (c-di-GMP phosphodiesterase class II)